MPRVGSAFLGATDTDDVTGRWSTVDNSPSEPGTRLGLKVFQFRSFIEMCLDTPFTCSLVTRGTEIFIGPLMETSREFFYVN